MTRTLLSLIFVLSVSLSAQAQVPLMNYFNIIPNGADVLLEWELQAEENITEFRIFRRFNDEQTLTHVSTLTLNGTRKYSYLDDNIFKTEGRILHYELQVIADGKTYRFTRSLSHNPTSVQRTWGSIKAMFR